MFKQYTLRIESNQYRELSIIAAATDNTLTALITRAVSLVIEGESAKDPRIAAMLREMRKEA